RDRCRGARARLSLAGAGYCRRQASRRSGERAQGRAFRTVSHPRHCGKRRAHIILGWADKNLKGHCDALGIKLHEYEWDRSLMLQRTPAIIEGLLRIV